MDQDKKLVEKYYSGVLKQVEKIMGSQETMSSQLNDFAKNYIGTSYVGTYSSDQIPKLKSGEMCIVNLDKSNQRGSHWVALCKDATLSRSSQRSANQLIFYDSFGRSVKKIMPSVRELGKIIETENDKEQYKKEQNCGQRCLAFCLCFQNLGGKLVLWI